ncbi:hypothetical protein C2S53_003735 [Perilla frutescens var. hirtella]|uniref:WEB family protein n=1 Tax=Perilla frutescens var. hirtella TaxID=608512 RepID=A0AAD4J4E1_PERFH|nr:hypothetical protein C2S53_003735 [Perilla frutescens var. hirtella]
MEDVPSRLTPDDHQNPSSSVDSSRPFRSVKEAVAIFGERFLAGEIYSPKPFAFPKQEIPFFAPTTTTTTPQVDKSEAPPAVLADTVKKLETELQETKAELKLLKDRESETEVAVASLNAELHRNMSKLARAEAAAAAKAAAASSPSLGQVLSVGEDVDEMSLMVGIKKKEMMMMRENSKKKKKKQKPIIPLLGDLFTKKKGSSMSSNNPLYTSSHLHL